jgi:hypothetical protein
VEHVVFAEPTKARLGPLGYAEPRVNWYLESTRSAAAVDREYVNSWYSEIPDPHGRLLGRLRSARDDEHQQALDELLLHHLLRRNAEDVRYEELEGQSPDYSIYSTSGGYLAGIEVVSIFLKKDWRDEELRIGRFVDYMNRRVKNRNWLVDLSIIRWDANPPVSAIAQWIEDQLGRRDKDPLLDDKATYADDAIEFECEFIPVRTQPLRPEERLITGGPSIGGQITCAKRIRRALKAKDKKYNTRQEPFALFLVCHDTFCDLDDVVAALYGSAYDLDRGIGTRLNGGLFGRRPDRPHGLRRYLSCVFTVLHGWTPGSAESLAIYRLDNPFGLSRFPQAIVPCSQWFEPVRDGTKLRMAWVTQPE